MTKSAQPWLANPAAESTLILAPAIIPVIAVVIFQDYFTASNVSTFWWILLVLCIDVSHVYSTLFRMYWDKETFKTYKSLLVIIPLAGFAVGVLVHYYDSLVFWRLLAYTAVYHFVRQQYGFMRLYSRTQKLSRTDKLIDSFAIYSATIYPLLHWHMNSDPKIQWFVQGDFIRIPGNDYQGVLLFIYIAILLIYLVREAIWSLKNKMFNSPKNMVLIGTCLSWYVGIVLFEGDLVFTLLNVVAHGIPYMGLIWIHGSKRAAPSLFSFNIRGAFIFISVLFVLAYVEEHFWDVLIWRDHTELFPLLGEIPPIQNHLIVSMIVALLALPQITHYVLDGFIWRFSKDRSARVNAAP